MTGARHQGNRVSPTIVDRVRRFYTENPSEELSVEDIAVKFECGERTARYAVETLSSEGLIKRISVYRVLPAAQSAPAQPERTRFVSPGPGTAPAAELPNSHPLSEPASPASLPALQRP